jgi:cytochrome b involved in lipid metabolism
MFKKSILLFSFLMVSGFVFAGCLPGNQAVEEKETEVKMIAIGEIAEHAVEDDCWQAIGGKVYDFTDYIAKSVHPGGKSMIKDCGTDATFVYENDPEHSEYATSLLENFYIGELVK